MSSTWKRYHDDLDLWVADYQTPMMPSRSVAVKLRSGGFLIYSPGAGLVPSAQTELFSEGKPEVLLVPSSFHHLGLAHWKEHFPEVSILASQTAVSRVTRLSKQPVQPLGDLASQFPESIRLRESEGTRIGETWLQIESPIGKIWVTCDAFFNFSRLPNALLPRTFMTLMQSAPGVAISSLFIWGGLSDRKRYRSWFLRQLEEFPPDVAIPSHGKVLEGEDVAGQLRSVAERRL